MAIQIEQQADHGFDEPLELLGDGHRRVERSLGELLAVARAEGGGPLSAAGRLSLEQALACFRRAASHHTADEAEGLFPLLRAAEGPELVRVLAAVERLAEDHPVVEAGHARVDALASRWLRAQTLPEEDARELVEALASLREVYANHIQVEDQEVFPAAGRLLPAHAIEELGRRMSERRGLPYRGPLARFLCADHARLDGHLLAADGGAEGVLLQPFGAFRAGILEHIAMEEKRLIPAAVAAGSERVAELAPRLRADHAAIAALLAPHPDHGILAHLRAILTRHDRIEEQAGGLYDACDRALGAEAALRLVAALQAHPAVRLKAYHDGPRIREQIEAALARSREAWKA